MVNVTGDATVSVVVAKSEGQFDENVFYNPNADAQSEAPADAPASPRSAQAGS
jgi:Na+/H+-dicarboxylate symporter